jgi:hypothetical protein
MATSPLRCPECRSHAVLVITTATRQDEARPARSRVVRLQCPTGCTPSAEHLARLADPMAC